MRFVAGHAFAKEIADALGIDFPIMSIAITADCKSPAIVSIEFPVRDDQTGELVKVMRRYAITQPLDLKERTTPDV